MGNRQLVALLLIGQSVHLPRNPCSAPLLKREKIREESTSTVHRYYVQVAALQRCRLPHIIAGPAAGILIIDSLMISGQKYQTDGPWVLRGLHGWLWRVQIDADRDQMT